ncbi:MAG: ABC transporter ATP-binding protein [Alphaproteobacteria bacterium]|jgi:ABC-type branched-subunit amino acid transport system ATPase component|nr:ABC transporter ATP-binding protein [Alphaproteobacteria bacterium]MBT5859855.1 ABC transporter ATP-binding protein [Alphaproteobacteria bacterium]
MTPRSAPCISATDQMLELADIHAGYGQVPVLRGVSLVVEPGTVMGLMGRNGMGKTTLCNVCNGLLATASGSVRLDGHLVTGNPAFEIAQQGMATVPQGRDLFEDFTVDENLGLGGPVPVEIYDWFPGLVPLRNRLAGTLSGGEQQMVAIGRALARKPKVLLLDEPSEGLQPSVIHDMGAVLRRIVDDVGLTILLVEQHVELVQAVAGSVAFLADGVIAEQVPIAVLSDSLNDNEGPVHRHLSI